ncbi:hypothetical protein CBL_08507 [Carabus blaptoides fortunei]
MSTADQHCAHVFTRSETELVIACRNNPPQSPSASDKLSYILHPGKEHQNVVRGGGGGGGGEKNETNDGRCWSHGESAAAVASGGDSTNHKTSERRVWSGQVTYSAG